MDGTPARWSKFLAPEAWMNRTRRRFLVASFPFSNGWRFFVLRNLMKSSFSSVSPWPAKTRKPCSLAWLAEFLILFSSWSTLAESFNSEYYIDPDNIAKNFLDPDTVPFLICNYSNETYDSYLHRLRPQIPVFLVHFILFLKGKSYHYSFPLDDYRNIFVD